MKMFGTLKKKQEGGFGKLVKKFETKHVDLNLHNGVFTYVNKEGTKSRTIYFRVRLPLLICSRTLRTFIYVALTRISLVLKTSLTRFASNARRGNLFLLVNLKRKETSGSRASKCSLNSGELFRNSRSRLPRQTEASPKI